MLDVLEEEQALEDDCAAVLGNVSDTQCTYSQGYLARQPLYAAREATVPGQRAGVCLACSYHCLEGCELVELYTKRNFRCDCGTSRMTNKCKLEPKKEVNTRNRYNQNFLGLYCTCHRPYPDPEDATDDVMIQCVVCEDWLHGRHLNMGETAIPEDGSYSEMVCFECVEKLGFLQSYAGLSVVKVKNVKDADEVIEVSVADRDDCKCDDDKASSKESTKDTDKCKLKAQNSDSDKVMTSMFFPDKWRSSLCQCPACTRLYSDLNVEFLCDEADTVASYEAQAKEVKQTGVDKGMEALGQMDRVKQVEAIAGYNNMKQNLMEYLSKFADNKKVVREEDIKDFFDGMKNKRRRHDGPDSFA